VASQTLEQSADRDALGHPVLEGSGVEEAVARGEVFEAHGPGRVLGRDLQVAGQVGKTVNALDLPARSGR
jgi:hypothetical protein